MAQIDLIRKDLSELIVHQPFFASIILKQRLVVDPSRVATAGVNGVELVINGDWFLSHDPYERMTILAHEALHLTNKHNLRRMGRDHRLFNIACDMAINKHLTKAPFKLPQQGSFDELNKYGNGADAEYIYSCLLNEVDEQMKENEEAGEEEEPPSDTESQPDQDSQDSQDDQGDDQDGDDQSGQDDGKSARDKAIEDIQDKYKSMSMGDVMDHPEAGKGDIAVIETNQDIDTNIAMQVAKKRGKMPATIMQDIIKSYEKKVDWKTILSRWIEGVSPSDYSWLHPHDVHLQNDLIMPSMKADGYGKIMVAVDTSGSMSQGELKLAVDEVFNGLRAYHENGQEDVSVDLLYFDCVVQAVENISSSSQVTKPVGGGGTSFTPVFEYVAQMPNPPMGLILVTDGYCSVYQKDEPSCGVLWMLTDMDAKEFNAPFGECLEVRP
jgi:predicted metal-dependent peptidase